MTLVTTPRPACPTRPARPAMCAYSLACSGRSPSERQYTCVTFGKSSPLPSDMGTTSTEAPPELMTDSKSILSRLLRTDLNAAAPDSGEAPALVTTACSPHSASRSAAPAFNASLASFVKTTARGLVSTSDTSIAAEGTSEPRPCDVAKAGMGIATAAAPSASQSRKSFRSSLARAKSCNCTAFSPSLLGATENL